MASSGGPAKLKEVTSLLEKLSADLQQHDLSRNDRDKYLEQLKVHGRDPSYADPIFTKEGITTLARHAFESPDRTTSQNALRCLANALVLTPQTQHILLELNYEAKACELLKNDSRDDEFLLSRIIFLLTYTTKLDIEGLIDKHELAHTICMNIQRHKSTRGNSLSDPMEDMSLAETLKLLFNLTHFCPQQSSSFVPALPHILAVLSKRQLPDIKPLDPVVTALINATINIPLDGKETQESLFNSGSIDHVDRLVVILEKATNSYPESELDTTLSPLLTFLRSIYAVAPENTKQHLQKLLLPSEEDREEVLGKGKSLPSRLLRLTNNPATPTLRDLVSGLLFELSDKDATIFVQNIGYGLASGFLFQHKIPVPDHLSGSSSQKADGTGIQEKVNPITGQFLDREANVPEIEMTQEEKEREAERLFVLFERLRATGVMNVENPVTKAYQEGRFEELPDDA